MLQLAKARLRESLRAKENVAWDATGLREDGRAMVLGLGHAYHAHTRIVAFASPPETLHRRNRERPHMIPSKVIDRQLDRLQWPNGWEAHEIVTVAETSSFEPPHRNRADSAATREKNAASAGKKMVTAPRATNSRSGLIVNTLTQRAWSGFGSRSAKEQRHLAVRLSPPTATHKKNTPWSDHPS